MNWILKIVIAIVLGVLVAAVLNYFGIFNSTINNLIGFLVALAFYFGYDGTTLPR